MQYIYLIISYIYGKRNPLYYLIFAIAIVAGSGMFIDTRTTLGQTYFIPPQHIYLDIVSIYLIVVALLLKNKYKSQEIPMTPMNIYAIYIIFIIIYTLGTFGLAYKGFNVMRNFIEMVISFYTVYIILTSSSYKQFVQFINTMMFITGILSICYVINSSGTVSIFDKSMIYSEVNDYNDGFLRDFNSIPYFSELFFLFSFTSIIFKDKGILNRKAIYLNITTYPFVLLYTFTRGLIIYVVIMCLILILVCISKRGLKSLSKIIAIFIFVSITIFIINNSLTNETSYLSERFSLISGKNNVSDDANVDVRIADHLTAFNILQRNNVLLQGDGMNAKHYGEMDKVGAWAADTTIPTLILHSGIIGAILFFILGFFFSKISYKTYRNANNLFSLSLSVYLLITTCSYFFTGGNSFGPFQFLFYAMAAYLYNVERIKCLS